MGRHHIARVVLDEPLILPLAADTLGGDEKARLGLWVVLRPSIVKIADRCRVTRWLHDRENTRSEVAFRVMAGLEANGFKQLRTFFGLLQHLNGRATRWFRTVAHRAALRCTEQHPENLGPAVEKDKPSFVEVESLSEDRVEDLLPVSARMVGSIFTHEVLRCAEGLLDPRQLDALRLHALGHGTEEIAGKLALGDAAVARRLVRAAKKRLHHRFGEELAGARGEETDADEGDEGREEDGDEAFIFRDG